MKTETAHEKINMSDRDLKYTLSLVEEVKAIIIPESHTWIYESIVKKIRETSSTESEPQKLLKRIISDYQTEGQYNESLIAVWPDEARIGKENKRKENEILLFNISFIEEVQNLLMFDQELTSGFFKVNLIRKGLIELESVKKLKENGIKTRTILEHIKGNNIASHIIALFHHLGFLEYIKRHYHCKNNMDVAREILSWMNEGKSEDTIEKPVRYYLKNRKGDKEYDNPLELAERAFPL